MEQEPKHRRRVRYRGTHPHSFQEKYKELNPGKYAKDVEKIIGSGKTPAGMHIPICVNEILDFLRIQPGQIGLDATLGYGGHTQRMLECLRGSGRLYATDVDPIESEKTRARLAELGYGSEILTVLQMNFADADQILPEGRKFDFVLADLGVSSMQIDNPTRGFTFKYDGPLDLRMNPEVGTPASQRLLELTREETAAMLTENSDEPYAGQIAAEIHRTLSHGEISTTCQLAQTVERALTFLPPQERAAEIKKSCRRTFQALRIDVNSEFEALYSFLEKLPDILKPGGRAAILTFHSGEDRMVKKALQLFYRQGAYSEIAKDVIRPSAEECYCNPRAHSAKMRWAVKS